MHFLWRCEAQLARMFPKMGNHQYVCVDGQCLAWKDLETSTFPHASMCGQTSCFPDLVGRDPTAQHLPKLTQPNPCCKCLIGGRSLPENELFMADLFQTARLNCKGVGQKTRPITFPKATVKLCNGFVGSGRNNTQCFASISGFKFPYNGCLLVSGLTQNSISKHFFGRCQNHGRKKVCRY